MVSRPIEYVCNLPKNKEFKFKKCTMITTVGLVEVGLVVEFGF